MNLQLLFIFIEDNSASKYFSINEETGELSIRKRIDRESNEISELGDLLEFTIIAKEVTSADHKEESMSMAHITVAIIDINDNDPTFEASSYNLTVTPKVTNGTVLTIINEKSIYVYDLDKVIKYIKKIFISAT